MKKLIILPIILLSLVLVTGCGCSKKESTNKASNNVAKLTKEQIVNEIKFSSMSLVYENNDTNFIAIVTNTSKESKNIGIIDIIFKDKNGNEITTLKGLVGKTLASNGSSTINASTGIDLTNAYSIEFKI